MVAARQRVLKGELDEGEDRDPVTGSFLCRRKCDAMRYCGRHVCARICCPLSALASVRDTKGKKRAQDIPTPAELAEIDPEGWHTCDRVRIASTLPPMTVLIIPTAL